MVCFHLRETSSPAISLTFVRREGRPLEFLWVTGVASGSRPNASKLLSFNLEWSEYQGDTEGEGMEREGREEDDKDGTQGDEAGAGRGRELVREDGGARPYELRELTKVKSTDRGVDVQLMG